MKTRYLILIILFCLFCSWEKKKIEKTPNIVLILADDLGFSDIGCLANRKLKPLNPQPKVFVMPAPAGDKK